jgi:tRNA (adenine22-N1)-methyltransferase
MIPKGSRVADIGTDAAVLPRVLLRGRRAEFCLASDSNPRGLETAKRLAGRQLETGRLELRRASGLTALTREDRIDVITIAGLGARSTLRILDDERLDRLGVGRLVLQPQSEAARIRRWLHSRGYAIVDEALIRQRGCYYTIIAAEPREDALDCWRGSLTLGDLFEAGPCLLRWGGPHVRCYWERERRRHDGILLRPGGGAARAAARCRRDLALRVLAELPRGSAILATGRDHEKP